MNGNEIKKTLTDAGKDVASAARSLGNMTADAAEKSRNAVMSLISLVKSRLQIFREEDRIRESETALGRLYYDSYVSGSLPDADERQKLFEEISAARERVAVLRGSVSDRRASDSGDVSVNPDEITDEDFVIPGMREE